MKKNDLMTENRLGWRVHTPNLIKEILGNKSKDIAALRIPIAIFLELLVKVGERASQLNDKELNKLMTRLTVYEFADPQSKHYDDALLQKILSD